MNATSRGPKHRVTMCFRVGGWVQCAGVCVQGLFGLRNCGHTCGSSRAWGLNFGPRVWAQKGLGSKVMSFD